MVQAGETGLTDVGVAGATRRFRGWCLPTIISHENEMDALELGGVLTIVVDADAQ